MNTLLILAGLAAIVFVVMGLKHRHKWGEVQEDGYQYCEGCNKAQTDGDIPCKHEWETIKEDKISTTMTYSFALLSAMQKSGGQNGFSDLVKKNQEPRETGYLYVMKCKKCGDIKDYKVEI